MRKKEEPSSQSQESDDKSVEEVVKESRCPLPPPIERDLRIIAKNAGLSHCEQLENFVVQGITSRMCTRDSR